MLYKFLIVGLYRVRHVKELSFDLVTSDFRPINFRGHDSFDAIFLDVLVSHD